MYSSSRNRIVTLAASQWGLLSTAQFGDLGIQRNQIQRLQNEGSIEKIRRGIYSINSISHDNNIDIKAAWLSIFPKQTAAERLSKTYYDAIVVGRTAACLYDYGNFYSSPYSFATKERKQTRLSDISFFVWDIEGKDIRIKDSIPVTSPERIVADLIRLREDPSLVADFINDAIANESYFDFDRLIDLLAPLAYRNGFKKNDGKSFVNHLFSQYLSKNSSDQMKNIVENIALFDKDKTQKNMFDIVRNAYNAAHASNNINELLVLLHEIGDYATNETDLQNLQAIQSSLQLASSSLDRLKDAKNEISNTSRL